MIKNFNSKTKRLLFGFFMPILSVPLVGFINILFNNPEDGGDFLKGFLIIILFSFVFVGIQSLLYSFIMEYIVNPHIENHLICILLSGFLGFLSGYVINETLLSSGRWGLFGLGVGIVSGTIIRFLYVKSKVSNSEGMISVAPIEYSKWAKVTTVVTILNILVLVLIGFPFTLFILLRLDEAVSSENINNMWMLLLSALVFVLVIYAYISLLYRKYWARDIVILFSFIQCVAFPVGTILGVLMLVSLFKSKLMYKNLKYFGSE